MRGNKSDDGGFHMGYLLLSGPEDNASRRKGKAKHPEKPPAASGRPLVRRGVRPTLQMRPDATGAAARLPVRRRGQALPAATRM